MGRKSRTPCWMAAACAAFVAACPSPAAEPVVQWASQYAGGESSTDFDDHYGWNTEVSKTTPRHLSVLDSAGNLYLLAHYKFGYPTLLVTKFSPQGTSLWSRPVGREREIGIAVDIGVDCNDDVVVLTEFGFSRTFGVFKFRGPDGVLVWRNAQELFVPASYSIYPTSMKITPLGDVIFLRGGPTASRLSSTDGTVVWEKTLTGGGDRQLLCDSDGNAIVISDENLSGTGRDLRVRKLSFVDGTQIWSTRYDSLSRDEFARVATWDGSGNILVSGTSAAAGDTDIVTVKISGANGTVIWARRWAGSAAGSYDQCEGIAADAGGDVYVAGRTGNSANPDLVAFRLRGLDGTPVWSDLADGAFVFAGAGGGADSAHDVAVDAAGDVVIVGQVRGNTGAGDFAVLKLRGSDGTVRWNQYTDGIWRWNPTDGTDVAYAVCLESGGGIVATGTVWNDPHRYDIGIARLDADGGNARTTAWHQPYNSTVDCVGGHAYNTSGTNKPFMQVDAAGNTWLLGGSQSRMIALKFDSAGNRVLTKPLTIESSTNHAPRALLRDAAGDLVAVGAGAAAACVAKFRSTDGEMIWSRRYPSYPRNFAALDGAGNIFLAGPNSSGGTGITDSVVKLDGTDGTPLWNVRTTGYISQFAVDPDGNVVLWEQAGIYTGDHRATVKIRGSDGTALWSAPTPFAAFGVHAGASDIYLAGKRKLARLRSADGTMVWTEPADGVVATSVPAALGRQAAIIVCPDGNIVVGGSDDSNFAIGKFRAADGTPMWTDLPGNVAGMPLHVWGGLNTLRGLVVNAAGDVYASIRYNFASFNSGEWALLKLRGADGQPAWPHIPLNAAMYSGDGCNNDNPVCLHVDAQGGMRVAGTVFNDATYYDIALVKYVEAEKPTVSATFLSSPVAAGSNTRIRFDLTNPNPGVVLNQVQFSAPLPSALEIAAAPDVLNELGGTLTAVAGGSSIRLVAGTLPAGATLSIEVTLLAKVAGVHRCTTSVVRSDELPGTETAFDDIEIVPGPLAALNLAGFPSPVNAGAVGTFEVQAFDAFGNLATNFTGTVKFRSSDPSAALPADYAFTEADAGKRTFSAILKAGGIHSLTVESAADAGIADTQGDIAVSLHLLQISVTFLTSPAAAGSNTRIRFDIANPNPSLALTGVGFENPIPEALQIAGVPDVLNELGGTLTAAPGGSSIKLGGGSLPAGATKSVEVDLLAKTAGTHVNTVGPASAEGVAAGSGASDEVVIAPGAVTVVTLAGFPEAIAAGTAGGFEVQVFDGQGNLATNFTGSVRFTSTDPDADLPADYAFTSGDAGKHTFAATLNTFGTHNLTVALVADAGVTDSQSGIVVGDANSKIVAAVSRRTHDGVGRNIALALGAGPAAATVEPRVGGAREVVLTFGRSMKSVKGVKPGSGHITVDGAALVEAEWNDDKTKLTLHLTAAAATCVRIHLDPTKFSQGGSVLWGTTEVCVRVLAGDADGNGVVNAADIALVRSFKGKAAGAANFRCDINRNGTITEADAAQAAAALGLTVP